MCDLVDRIIDYETGQMNDHEAIEFFQELVDTGIAWQLQGHYGRTATQLIDLGLVKKKTGRRNGGRMDHHPNRRSRA